MPASEVIHRRAYAARSAPRAPRPARRQRCWVARSRSRCLSCRRARGL